MNNESYRMTQEEYVREVLDYLNKSINFLEEEKNISYTENIWRAIELLKLEKNFFLMFSSAVFDRAFSESNQSKQVQENKNE